jgi:hypothetical protein
MNYTFNKKSKKSPRLSQQHLVLGLPTNVAAGPLGFRAELDIGPKGEETRFYHGFWSRPTWFDTTLDEESPRTSRIAFHDKRSEGQQLPAPETSTPSVAVASTEHGNDLTGECF